MILQIVLLIGLVLFSVLAILAKDLIKAAISPGRWPASCWGSSSSA